MAAESRDDRWQEENLVASRLIAASLAGDPAAFEQLYDCTAARVLASVRRIVGDAAAEDVLAEVYLQVWNSLPLFDGSRAPALGWLAMIARSRALDHRRREKVQRDLQAHPQLQVEGEMPDRNGPEELCAREQECRLVRGFLHGPVLSPQERLVLELAYYREHTQEEISTLVGLPLGTVKTTITRAQVKLRDGVSTSLRMRPDSGSSRVLPA